MFLQRVMRLNYEMIVIWSDSTTDALIPVLLFQFKMLGLNCSDLHFIKAAIPSGSNIINLYLTVHSAD